MQKISRTLFFAFIALQPVASGWLGIVVQDLTPQLAFRYGLRSKDGTVVTRVQFNSPAMKAGLEEGDVIIALNEEKIPDSETLKNSLSNTPPGSRIHLTIIRNRIEKALEIILGSPPKSAA